MDLSYAFSLFTLSGTLLFGGISDMYTSKVKNKLILICFFLLSLWKFVFSEPILFALTISLIPLLACFPLYRRRLLGAADIKLFSLIFYTFPSFYGCEILFLGLAIAVVFYAFCLCGAFLFKEDIAFKKIDRRRLPLTPFLLFGTMLRTLI